MSGNVAPTKRGLLPRVETAVRRLVTPARSEIVEAAPSRAGVVDALAEGALRFDASSAIAHLCKVDRRLAIHIARARPFALHLKPAQTTFHALAESIVYQQLSGKAAATIFSRVEAACGVMTPERVLSAGGADLRRCGLSAAKLAALTDLATKAMGGAVPSVDELHRLDDEAIVERLTQVRGIGRWTVEMLLIFRLGRPDVLPVHDYGVRKGFAIAYRRKELPTPKELAVIGEKWRPFRTVASWYLWRVLDSPGGRSTVAPC